jgi:hypothetical protein
MTHIKHVCLEHLLRGMYHTFENDDSFEEWVEKRFQLDDDEFHLWLVGCIDQGYSHYLDLKEQVDKS